MSSSIGGLLTLDTGFPNGVGVLKARYDVIADFECEFQAVFTTFFQCKPISCGFSILWNSKDNVISPGRNNWEAKDPHFRFKSFYIKSRENQKHIKWADSSEVG